MAGAGAASIALSRTMVVKSVPWHPTISQIAPSGQVGGAQWQVVGWGRGATTGARSPAQEEKERPGWQDSSGLTESATPGMMGTASSQLAATSMSVPSAKGSIGPRLALHTPLSKERHPPSENKYTNGCLSGEMDTYTCIVHYNHWFCLCCSHLACYCYLTFIYVLTL